MERFYSVFLVLSAALVCPVFAASSLIGYKDIGTVLTPSRLDQPISHSPSTVTVITKSEIETLGLNEIAEVLRLVPGVAVGRNRGNDYRVSLHGNHIKVRRWEVMIDGRSQFRPATSEIDWIDLPISINDIERIEISRTSSTTSYGTNAFLGVVNFITQTPIGTNGISTRVTVGTQSHRSSWIRYGIADGVNSHRISISSQRDSGFNHESPLLRDDIKVDRINYSGIITLMPSDEINLFAGHSRSNPYFPGIDGTTYRKYRYNNGEKSYAQINYKTNITNNHLIKLNMYGRQEINDDPSDVCTPAITLLDEFAQLYRINPLYTDVFLGSSPPPVNATSEEKYLLSTALSKIESVGLETAFKTVCGFVDQKSKEDQYEVRLEDIVTINSHIRMGLGVGYRKDILESDVFLAGKVNEATQFAYQNLEFIPRSDWIINMGLLSEKRFNDSDFSAKISINKKWNLNHNLRLISLKSHRMPDIFSQKANWSYRVTDISPSIFSSEGHYFISTKNSTDLDPEQLIAHEIGYRFESDLGAMMIDIRAFNERLYHLISERLTIEDFNPTNHGELNMKGGEIEFKFNPKSDLTFRLGYGYLDAETNNKFETVLEYRHAGSAYLFYTGIKNWILSWGYYGTDRSIGTYYDRWDFASHRYWKNFKLTGKVSYFSNTENELVLLTSNTVDSNESSNKLFSPYQTYISIEWQF
ncbi:MAG: TonB-dependent receptor plug domain-containing protein [Gammaproteobacteria bacterium]